MAIDLDYKSSFIDGNKIARAFEFYSKYFKLIPVPMCVDGSSILQSVPPERRNMISPLTHTMKSFYVGSAEQSFLFLQQQGLLDKGNYMAITPCQRFEFEDDLHYSIFIKIELIMIGERNPDIILNIAKDFFSYYDKSLEIVPSGNKDKERDIIINNIEVGSYGIWNTEDNMPYCYGTGIAEPRLTYALSK